MSNEQPHADARQGSVPHPFVPPHGPPAHGPPAYGPPAYGPPAYPATAYGPPAYGPPAYPATAYGPPAYGPPAYPATAYGPPAYGPSAYPTPANGQPGYPATAYRPPAYGVPHNLAGWGLRVGASLIDGFVPLFLMMPAVVYAIATQQATVDRYGYPSSEPTAAGLLVMLLGWLAAFGFSLWNRTFRQGRTGQSLGKQAMRLRLVKEQTLAPTGPGLAFLRDLAHNLDSAAYIGYFWPLWDTKRQTFADKVCATYVVTV